MSTEENKAIQENVRTVQELFAAFERGDMPRILSTLTDDVEWWAPGPPEVPYAGMWRALKG